MVGDANSQENLHEEIERLRQRISEFERGGGEQDRTGGEVERIEQMMSEILNTLPEHIVLYDEDHTILWANKGAAETVDMTPTELVGRKCHELWHERTSPCPDCHVAPTWDTDLPSEGELVRDGRYMHFKAFPLPGPDGKVGSVLEVSHDVTAERMMTRTLEEHEGRYRTLTLATFDAIIIHDGRTIFETNKSAALNTGYSSEELIGMDLMDLIDPEDRQRLIDNVRSGRTEPYTVKGVRKDGTTIDAEVVGTTIPYKGGEAWVAAIRDISERRRAEETLKERMKELDCLYSLSQLVEVEHPSLTELLADVVKIIPRAWRYPEITCVRISIEGDEASTDNSKETEWSQSADIMIHGKKAGIIEVRYLEERPDIDEGPFLREERSLMDAIAEHLGRFIERRRAEERVEHLNRVLRAIRNVNQLIVQEKDRDRLLQGVCEALMGTLGYDDTWITLVDDDGAVTATFQASPCEGQIPVSAGLEEGYLPSCARAAMGRTGVVVTEPPSEACGDCPIEEQHRMRGVLTSRLEHGGRVHGLLSVAIPREFVMEDDEQALFDEVSSDIAFALWGIEVEGERKRGEEALKESEERYRTLTNATFDGIIVQKRGSIIEANKGFADIFGYEPDEMIHMKPGDLIAPGDKDRVLKIFHMGYDKPFEFVGQTKDGERVEVEAVSKRMVYRGEGVRVAAVRDISERNRAVEAIRESEERYRLLAENIQDVIWAMDPDMNFTYISPSIFKQRGYSPEEAIAQQLLEVIAPGSIESAMEMVDTFLIPAREGTVEPNFEETFDLELIRRDGSTVWTETTVTMISDDDGQLISILGVSRDISGRKLAVKAIEESEARYRLLAENSADVILVLNLDLGLDYISPSIERLTGYRTEEFEDLDWMSLLTPESFDHVMTLIGDGLFNLTSSGSTGLEGLLYEVEMIRKDGTTIWVEAVTNPILDVDGNIVKFVAVVRDIQERKRTQERYLKARERAEFYLDVFSHDIMNINQGIIDYLEMTKSNLGLRGADATFVNNTIRRQTQISDLVTNVELLTHLREGEFQSTTVDPSELLQAATAEVLARYPNRIIKVYVEDKGQPSLVEAHPMLKDVFKNILNHAVENDKNSQVVIEVVMRRTQDGKWVRLDFKDRGPGIPDEIKVGFLNRLGDKNRSIFGSGLGLAVVREFIAMVQGKVWVEDRVKGDVRKGANFVLVLPSSSIKNNH